MSLFWLNPRVQWQNLSGKKAQKFNFINTYSNYSKSNKFLHNESWHFLVSKCALDHVYSQYKHCFWNKLYWLMFLSQNVVSLMKVKKSKKSELLSASSESYITSANQLFCRFCCIKVVSDVWFEHFFQKLIY